MKYRTVPFGYKVVDGKAEINETEKDTLLKVYELYLSGKSLTVSTKEAGIPCWHGSAARMLLNKKYLGDDFYPPIITQEMYDSVVAERYKRAESLGRLNKAKEKEKLILPHTFTMKTATKEFSNPFEQAAYLYSLIESED